MNKKVIIEGEKVHHVGYRPFLLAKAWELKIPDYQAKNLKENGTEIVEVSIGGEEGQITEFIEFIKNNYPPEAKVSEVKDAEPPERVIPIDKYAKVLGAEQQNKMVQTGLMMVDKQDETIKVLGEKIESGFTKTDQDFKELRQDYGKISSDISVAVRGIEQVAKNTERILEHLSQQQENFTDAINGQTKAILTLAEKKA